METKDTKKEEVTTEPKNTGAQTLKPVEEVKKEVVKSKHDNIHSALSSFQGENPEIKKTKQFGKAEDKMNFMYASLDEMLMVVRPLTSKHGLSFTWEGEGDLIQCVLYHDTYKREKDGETIKEVRGENGETIITKTPYFTEKNVIRSLPISVLRKGEKKTVGADSTYARKYTLGEVLGISSDEDLDAQYEEKKSKNRDMASFMVIKNSIKVSTDLLELNKKVEFLKKEINTTIENESKKPEEKQAPSLGLEVSEYEELLALTLERITSLTPKTDGK